jgi:ribonuclease HII
MLDFFYFKITIQIMNPLFLAGIDEAGRGALAGPIVAGAVILPEFFPIDELGDSKKLTDPKRRELFILIQEKCDLATGFCSSEEVDKLGVKKATREAMQRAIEKLKTKPRTLLIDGNDHFQFDIPREEYIKGDDKIPVISAASIVAKVTRDNYMIKLGKKYSQFGFENHMGYGAVSHMDLLKQEIYCPEHRKSYNPLKTVLTQRKLF